MKKIVIPAILAATVLVAGMFAFMPIEKASTVHTTISTQIATQASRTTDFTLNNAADTIVPSSTKAKSGQVCVQVTDADGADVVNLQVDTVGDGAAASFKTLTDAIGGSDLVVTVASYQCLHFAGFGLRVLDDAGGNGVTITFTAVFSTEL